MPRLVAQSPEFSGQVFPLEGEELTVGRLSDNTIQLQHASVSGHHGVLQLRDLDYLIKDLDSTNGTRVNGERIVEHKLRRNDMLRLGNIELLYDSEHSPPGQPMPTPADRVNLSECQTSGRPPGFSNAAPVPKKVRGQDRTIWTWVFLGLSLAAAAGVGYFVYSAFINVTPLT